MHTVSEYKGNTVITLKRSDNNNYGFTFGLAKAKLIIDHLEEVKQFYEEHKDDKEKNKKSV